jgi:hypothetical protein
VQVLLDVHMHVDGHQRLEIQGGHASSFGS